MKKGIQIAVIFSVFMGLFSCSMVKQPQSANFQRVKYNSHLKLAKKNKTKKLEPTIAEAEETAKVDERNTSIEKLERNNKYKNMLLASASNEQMAIKSEVLELEKVEQQIKVDDDKSQSHTIFSRAHRMSGASAINDYLAKPMPAAASAPPLGDILYVVLVVILILIVISLIADLAGGLVGALIAVLLILLILRLLGYL